LGRQDGKKKKREGTRPGLRQVKSARERKKKKGANKTLYNKKGGGVDTSENRGFRVNTRSNAS